MPTNCSTEGELNNSAAVINATIVVAAPNNTLEDGFLISHDVVKILSNTIRAPLQSLLPASPYFSTFHESALFDNLCSSTAGRTPLIDALPDPVVLGVAWENSHSSRQGK